MISKAPEASTCVADPTRSSGSDVSLHRILLIVSDTMMQLNLSSRLRMAGFEVLVVSGTEVAKSRLHSFNPHAVVLDLGMEDPPFEKFFQWLRRDPGASSLPVLGFTGSTNPSATKRALKVGASQVFTDATRVLDDLAGHLETLLATRPGLPEAAAEPGEVLLETAPRQRELRAALGRVADHLGVLEQARNNFERAEIFGELRGKLQPVLKLARSGSHPGLDRLTTALHALLKVLHQMPECAAATTGHTVSAAVERLLQLHQSAPLESIDGRLELTAVVGDNDLVSRSVVCSALRSVGFKFECFNHASLVLRYFDSNEADLVIAHLTPNASTDREFGQKLRAQSRHAQTPVILVNGVSDFEAHARVPISGLDEIITKPFIFMELSVKALTLALKKRLASQPQPEAPPAPTDSADEPAPQLEMSSDLEVVYDENTIEWREPENISGAAAPHPAAPPPPAKIALRGGPALPRQRTGTGQRNGRLAQRTRQQTGGTGETRNAHLQQ